MYLNNQNYRGVDDPDYEYEEWQINEIKKCIKDPIYFILNYIKIIDGDEGLIKFQPRDYSIKFIKTIHENNYVLTKFPRQSGKSITVAAYMTWYAIFNANKYVVLLAHQKSMASEQLNRIKGMIQNLPLWIQQPVIKANESVVGFSNGSRITCAATSPNAVRGRTVNFLYLDEFAFVEPHIAQEFIATVFPTISSMKTSKVVATSTPNGLNHFHDMWVKAITKIRSGTTLTYKDWRTLEISWNEVPNRDEEWKKGEIEKIGEVRFKQEYECEFLGSVATLIDSKFLAKIQSNKPTVVLDHDRLRIYEYPMDLASMNDKGYEYLITVDPAMGTKQDYSVSQVWLVMSNTKVKQVAVYESNDIIPKKYIDKIDILGKMYNDAGIIVETMEPAGGAIISGLHYDKNYPNLIHLNENGLGFNLSHNRKIEACVYLQVYVEKDLVNIVDERTISQLSTFGKKGNTYKALGDAHDDLVTSILSMLYYLNSPYYYGNMDDEPIYKKKSISDELDGFDDEGNEELKAIKNKFKTSDEPEDIIPTMYSLSNKIPLPDYEQKGAFKSSTEYTNTYSYLF